MVSPSNHPEPRRGASPSVEILAVGTELLLGQLVDTNTPHIAQALAGAGINVFGTHTAGDNRERIAATIRAALERVDGLITSGGLGPTVDDLTKEAVCDALEVDTEFHEQTLRELEEAFAQSGRQMRENNRKQAFLPRGSVALSNKHGTATGFVAFRKDGKFVASMPGVPSEMKPMLADELIPWLRAHFAIGDAIYTRVLHTIGLAESEIDHRIDDLFRELANPKIAVLAHDYRCDVKIMAKARSTEEAQGLIAPVEHDIVRRLSGHVFGVDEQTLPGAIHAILQQTRRTIAVAESCTGGSICARLTEVPGSSKSFVGGIIAYDNDVKLKALRVSEQTLERFGAVSEETAREMAQGVRAAFGADVALSTTGIAGPSGGSAEKPVGLVWIALAIGNETITRRMQLSGDRRGVQGRATTHALGLVWKTLSDRSL